MATIPEEKAQLMENNKTIANERAKDAQNLLESMENILNHALTNDCTIDFDSLRFNDEFSLPKPEKPPKPPKPAYKNFPAEPDLRYLTPKPEKPPTPKEPVYRNIPTEPDPDDPLYHPQSGGFDFPNSEKAMNSKNAGKKQALEKFEADMNVWRLKKQEIVGYNQKIKSEYEFQLKDNEVIYKQNLEKWENDEAKFVYEQKVAWEREMHRVHEFNQKLKSDYEVQLELSDKRYQMRLENWENRRKEFLQEQKDLNAEMELRKEDYFNLDPEALEYYSKLILSNSEYYEEFPQQFELEYDPENQALVIDYQLPSPDNVLPLKEVKYIQTRDEFIEKHVTKAQLNQLYDKILYQISLRTIYELYTAHEIDALKAIIFNGMVHSINPATGQEADSCVLSIQANKEEFE